MVVEEKFDVVMDRLINMDVLFNQFKTKKAERVARRMFQELKDKIVEDPKRVRKIILDNAEKFLDDGKK